MFLAQNKHKINILSGLILVALTLAAGISVYVVMQRQAESMLSKNLEALLQRDVRFFESQINQALNNTQTVATRLSPIKNMQLLASNPGNATAQVELQLIAKLSLLTSFTGMSFYDVRGHEVARTGHFSQKHDLRVPLKTKHRAFLLWDGHFILQVSSDILDPQGRRIGMVKTEANLPLLTTAYADIASIGKTGEFALCAPLADDEKKMDCFLSRISGKDFQRLPRVVEGKPLPMNYALNGETGIILTRDYRREQVVAAYSPVGASGLGMVIKIDREELYQPVVEQLKFIAPLLAALVMAGVLLLNFLVRPLVRKLVDSERATRDANAYLRDSEARFANIINLAADAIISVDEDQRILIFNYGAEQIFGYTAAEMQGQSLEKLLPERYVEAHRGHIRQFGTAPQTALHMSNRSDIFGRRRDGSEFFAEANISHVMENGRQVFTVFLRDISERKQKEQRIAHMANHDALTDLPNRHLLQDRIRQALIHSRRNGNQGAVLFIDLDKFKVINDTMGHDVGDLLLKEVAHRLVSSLRSQDTVARTGGDEFIVVLHNVATAQDAGTMAQKLLDALLLPYRFAGKELHISASIGIAVFPDDGEDADTLLKNSDAAMYHAKETGRNNCQFFARK